MGCPFDGQDEDTGRVALGVVTGVEDGWRPEAVVCPMWSLPNTSACVSKSEVVMNVNGVRTKWRTTQIDRPHAEVRC
jgi:hypothetical protein